MGELLRTAAKPFQPDIYLNDQPLFSLISQRRCQVHKRGRRRPENR